MRNQIAYDAYMGFLVKSFFYIGSLSFLIILCIFIIDVLFVLFAPKVTGTVIKSDIFPIGKKTRFIDYHSVFITYSFYYKGKEYQNSILNGSNQVILNGYYKTLNLLQRKITDNQITVYIFPFNPKISIILPFQEVFVIKIAFIMLLIALYSSAKYLNYI